MFRNRPSLTAAIAGAVTAATLCVAPACGAADSGFDIPPSEPCEITSTDRLMRLQTGVSWQFRISDSSGAITTKTQSVGPLEDVGGQKAGVSAFRLTTNKVGGVVVSWQEDTGTQILRHRELDMAGSTQTEEFYEPYKLRVDESAARLAELAMYTEEYTEQVTDLATAEMSATDKTETWTVESIGEEVVVPAGTFCAVRIHRVSTTSVGGGSDKTYWFAPGVGKVRETSVDREEALMAFTTP